MTGQAGSHVFEEGVSRSDRSNSLEQLQLAKRVKRSLRWQLNTLGFDFAADQQLVAIDAQRVPANSVD
jgi:hypothetical protein